MNTNFSTYHFDESGNYPDRVVQLSLILVSTDPLERLDELCTNGNYICNFSFDVFGNGVVCKLEILRKTQRGGLQPSPFITETRFVNFTSTTSTALENREHAQRVVAAILLQRIGLGPEDTSVPVPASELSDLQKIFKSRFFEAGGICSDGNPLALSSLGGLLNKVSGLINNDGGDNSDSWSSTDELEPGLEDQKDYFPVIPPTSTPPLSVPLQSSTRLKTILKRSTGSSVGEEPVISVVRGLPKPEPVTKSWADVCARAAVIPK